MWGSSSHSLNYTGTWVANVQKRMCGHQQTPSSKEENGRQSPTEQHKGEEDIGYDYTKVDRSLIDKEYEKDVAAARAEGGGGAQKELIDYARLFYGEDFMVTADSGSSQTLSSSNSILLTQTRSSVPRFMNPVVRLSPLLRVTKKK